MSGEFTRILARESYIRSAEGLPGLKELFRRQILKLWEEWVEFVYRGRLH